MYSNSSSAFRNQLIVVSHDGNHFANAQDAKLYQEVWLLLKHFDMVEGCAELCPVFEDNFHHFEYEALRCLLEGVRALLQLAQMEDVGFPSMKQVLQYGAQMSAEEVEAEKEVVFQQFGFPLLNNSQTDSLISLEADGVVELVKYVGAQLASEAYTFWQKPFYTKDPLKLVQKENISQGLEDLMRNKGIDKTLEFICSFVEDILNYYSLQIEQKAYESAESLRVFLEGDHFCDETDPIFYLLPFDVTVRQHVPLSCHLQQTKLLLLHKKSNQSLVNLEDDDVEMLNSLDMSGCWLWRAEGKDDSWMTRVDGHALYSENVEVGNGFWFTRGLEGNDQKETDACDGSRPMEIEDNLIQHEDEECGDMNDFQVLEEGSDDEKVEAAVVIQRWWNDCSNNRVKKQETVEDTEEYLFEAEDGVKHTGDNFGSFKHFGKEKATKDKCGSVPMEINEFATCHDPETMSVSTEWTFESLYGKKLTNSTEPTALYGSMEEELEMRRWLNDHSIHQSVGDKLQNLGVRNIGDLEILVKECPEALKSFMVLDQIKLKKAIESNL